MRRNRRNRWKTNDLTTETINGIIQSTNRERRDMDIRDVMNQISDITNAIDEACDDAEGRESEVQERMDKLEGIKDNLKEGRESLDHVRNVLSELDTSTLIGALDEAYDFGIE